MGSTSVGPDRVRYRLWTATHYYTFFKGKDWGYQPGGWNVALYDPGSSGPHPYSVLPFTFITHELPTTELETKGLGCLLAKINRALNIDKSDLAHWVHHYARPLGFVSGVGPDWRPRFTDGGFVPLVVRHDSTEDAPVVPEARYLESNIDIAALREYVRGEANQALAELDIPLTIATQSNGGSGGGAMAQSGLAIAANDADLVTYAKGRQPLFELHESRLAALICKVAAGVGGPLVAALEKVALDPSLRVVWPEVTIDLPGQARDQADQWELQNSLTDPIEILMRRQNLTEPEAIEVFRASRRRLMIASVLTSDPEAAIDLRKDDQDKTKLLACTEVTGVTSDMGLPGGIILSDRAGPESGVRSNVSPIVAVTPSESIPTVGIMLEMPSLSGTET
jgi:hypothetical protein